jgi:uncharacterized protein (TIGR01777 family)
MRFLITGGTGFLGRALTASLSKDGHQVIILSRQPNRRSGFDANVQVMPWDARSAEGWGHLVNGVDVILNLAGESIAGTGIIPSRWSKERKERILESRVQAGRAIVQAVEAATQKPRLLIQASAVGYYGPGDDTEITEDSPAGNDFLANVCTQWEASTQRIEKLGVRRVILRTGLVLSPHDSVLPRLMLPFKFFAGGQLGSGKQWYPWIHIDDEIRAIRFLIESQQADGAFNLTAPHPLTNKELSRVLGRVMGRPAVMPAPAFVLRLALGEMATIVLDGQRAVPSRLSKLGFQFNFPDAEAALRDLLHS